MIGVAFLVFLASIFALVDVSVNEIVYRFLSKDNATRFAVMSILALMYAGALVSAGVHNRAYLTLLHVLVVAGATIPIIHFISHASHRLINRV